MRFFSLLLLMMFSQSVTGQTAGNTDTASAVIYKRIQFKPTVFYREFFSRTQPVLSIHPGDTVSTESVDAGGFDKTGTRITERGNPLTGPLYIEGALQGDIIAVTILKVSLNRNYATTLDAFVPRALPKSIIRKTWREAKLTRWNLDLLTNTGSPADTREHLQSLKIPLAPFLGCVGVAPAGTKGISTSDSGPFGGNMDFKSITAGTTVYLPVFHKGGLLFMGDGHAAQGDGELNGDALETSMDFEFTVRIIRNENLVLDHLRIEDQNQIMAFGIGKNLDIALVNSTLNLLNWLQEDYSLSYKEASQVIGPSVEYSIPKIAATKVEVVARLSKEILKGLKKSK